MAESGCAVVLAGGRGSRLKPYTHVLPKPLIPVCDVPILEVVVQQLRQHGFDRLILAVNHHEGLIRSYFGDGSALGVDISYSKEDRPLGTVGPLHLIADRLPEKFLVMNGDLLTDLDYAGMLDAHAASGCVLTVGLHRRTVRLGDGVIDTNDHGFVTGFREKPRIDFSVSMGVYAMCKSVLEHIPQRASFGMDDLILSRLDAGQPVNTYRHEGEWYDIGSPEDLERANSAFAERRVRFLGKKSDLIEVA
jgi:NDP-mannose synthase